MAHSPLSFQARHHSSLAATCFEPCAGSAGAHCLFLPKRRRSSSVPHQLAFLGRLGLSPAGAGRPGLARPDPRPDGEKRNVQREKCRAGCGKRRSCWRAAHCLHFRARSRARPGREGAGGGRRGRPPRAASVKPFGPSADAA